MRVREIEREREQYFPLAGSLHKCPQQPGLHQAEAEGLELQLVSTWVAGT